MTIHDLTLAELRSRLDKRELSAVEVTNAYLNRIAATNEEINAFITICNETALAEAQAADQAIAAGQAAPLTGLPIAARNISSQRARSTGRSFCWNTMALLVPPRMNTAGILICFMVTVSDAANYAMPGLAKIA